VKNYEKLKGENKMNNKKLTKSSTDKQLGGVLGGLANYSNIDSTLIRLLFVVLFIISIGFPLLLIYVVAAVVIPYDTETTVNFNKESN
jgi:phage shock protein C